MYRISIFFISLLFMGAGVSFAQVDGRESLEASPPVGMSSGENRPVLALKTNLLFDAALTPNVEIEFPLRNNRYSLMAECWFPWYTWKDNSRAYQLLYVGAEARRWLGDRTRRAALEGHFLGVYAGGGKYDLEWDSEGYQGEFYIAAGVSYGYAKRLSRSLRLEFNVGVGFMRTDYRHYHAMEEGEYLVWQHDGRYTWIGPTKAKVSLVWLLHKKKGGSR